MIAVGTLSTRGWAKTTSEKITELMNHYTEAGWSQSVIYRGNIKSYAFTVAQYYQQPEMLCSQVETDLLRLFGNVFTEGVEVEARYEFVQDSDIRFNVIISLRVKVNGEWVDATRSVNVDPGGLASV